MRALVLGGALALDLALGEPPEPMHPVVWMGKLIALLERWRPATPASQRAWGAAIVAAGASLSFGLPALALRRIPRWARPVFEVALLKTAFSVRQLARQANHVQRALEQEDLAAARAEVGRLVSRPVATLSAQQIAAAAIESVAENTSDSIVAPLFWYCLLGVPGALAYRFVNTADAMIGYHGEYEHLGKAAARLDDALNFVPARLTAGLLIAGARLAGLDGAGAWRIVLRDHTRTTSPNAGWPMAAAAGALRVPLEKAGHYRLGDGEESSLTPAALGQAVKLMALATLLAIPLPWLWERRGEGTRGRRMQPPYRRRHPHLASPAGGRGAVA